MIINNIFENVNKENIVYFVSKTHDILTKKQVERIIDLALKINDSELISNAIKKLWESDNFSEVEVYVQSIEGDQVVLRFNLQDLKELGKVDIVGKGIGKSKKEKIIKDNDLKPGKKITNNLVSTLQTKIPQYKKCAKLCLNKRIIFPTIQNY